MELNFGTSTRTKKSDSVVIVPDVISSMSKATKSSRQHLQKAKKPRHPLILHQLLLILPHLPRTRTPLHIYCRGTLAHDQRHTTRIRRQRLIDHARYCRRTLHPFQILFPVFHIPAIIGGGVTIRFHVVAVLLREFVLHR